MGEHAHAVLDQLDPVPANGLTVRHIGIGKLPRGLEGEALLLGDRVIADHGCADFVKGIHQIHSRRPGGGQGLVGTLQMPRKGRFRFAGKALAAWANPKAAVAPMAPRRAPSCW